MPSCPLTFGLPTVDYVWATPRLGPLSFPRAAFLCRGDVFVFPFLMDGISFPPTPLSQMSTCLAVTAVQSSVSTPYAQGKSSHWNAPQNLPVLVKAFQPGFVRSASTCCQPVGKFPKHQACWKSLVGEVRLPITSIFRLRVVVATRSCWLYLYPRHKQEDSRMGHPKAYPSPHLFFLAASFQFIQLLY